MLGLVMFVIFLYSLVVGSVLYLIVGLLNHSANGKLKKVGKWCVCVFVIYSIICSLQLNGVQIIR